LADEARQAKERMASETHDRNLKLGVFRALQQVSSYFFQKLSSTHKTILLLQ
jgi:hypothetical protein